MQKNKFNKLLEPCQIGQVRTKNRIVKAGQGMGFASGEGHVSEIHIGHYEAIAKGGVGLIIIEATGISFPLSLTGPKRLIIDDDRFLPGFVELAKVVNRHSCPAFLQLHHAGPSHSSKVSGLQPVASSSMSLSELPRKTYGPTKGLTPSEIEDLVEKFANAAKRAQKAGFDGVEIHAAHGYLLNSFLSQAWNKRQDAYGGNLQNRTRFLSEIIYRIKDRVGQDYPIGIRINGAEYGVEKGITPEESQNIARILEQAGATYIHVSAYGFGEYNRVIQPEQIFYPEPPKPVAESFDKSHNGAGGLIPLAANIKKVVSIPIIGVGRLDPFLSERILRQGQVDLVAFGRRLMADPELPNKVASGRLEDIAPCTACLTCWDRVVLGKPVRCRINPALGREKEFEIKPADKTKRVLVVGGGPAGMEAARVAALRGHEVILYEKEYKLGGSMRLAAVIKGTTIEDLVGLTRYLETQIKKLGVKVTSNKEANLALIEGLKPDVVVLAMGGIPITPKIPGIDKTIVKHPAQMYRTLKKFMRLFNPSILEWLMKVWMPIGSRVVVLGGGIEGCELTEFLTKQGRKVILLETSNELGAKLVKETKERLLMWFAKKGVIILTGVKYEEITDEGITIITKDGEKKHIEADNILPALGLEPNRELFIGLKDKVPEVYSIGDCKEPHLILEAIDDGSQIGRMI